VRGAALLLFLLLIAIAAAPLAMHSQPHGSLDATLSMYGYVVVARANVHVDPATEAVITWDPHSDPGSAVIRTRPRADMWPVSTVFMPGMYDVEVAWIPGSLCGVQAGLRAPDPAEAWRDSAVVVSFNGTYWVEAKCAGSGMGLYVRAAARWGAPHTLRVEVYLPVRYADTGNIVGYARAHTTNASYAVITVRHALTLPSVKISYTNKCAGNVNVDVIEWNPYARLPEHGPGGDWDAALYVKLMLRPEHGLDYPVAGFLVRVRGDSGTACIPLPEAPTSGRIYAVADIYSRHATPPPPIPVR
jgi:hypothetical protein